MTAMWGIHNDTLTTQLVNEGFVSIGWDELGDLKQLPSTWEAFKSTLARVYPDRKPQAIAGWAGVLTRFRDDMQVGDVVVAPYKPDSTVNIGLVASDYYYEADATIHRHRRRIEWKRIGIPRNTFSQAARYEIGAFLTVFAVRQHADEFLAALQAEPYATTEQVTQAVEAVVETKVDDSPDEPRASRIAQHTRDFVLDALLGGMSHRDFEIFTADLLRALGYQARVTAYSQDGGVDVIAHHDPLGLEPPLIKVKCKHQMGTIGAPAVQQLVGTQGVGELSLFVTLGTYSPDARAIERQRSGLRLLTGEDVVDLVLKHYAALPEWVRAVIPLTSVLVVDDTADA